MTRPPSLGELLADSRRIKRLSLRQVAAEAHTSASHLSRLESGEREGISRDLLGRLAEVLDIEPSALFSAAHLLPPEVERQLADPDVAAAVVSGHRLPNETRSVLRRAHIAAIVARRYPEEQTQIDDLLREMGYAVQLHASEDINVELTTASVEVHCLSDNPETARFLAAHALGHLVLQQDPSCRFRRAAPEEFEATTFAAFLLAPPERLRSVILTQAGRMDVWSRGMTGNLIETAAVRLGAPAWLVARRVCEDRLLAEVAEVGEL